MPERENKHSNLPWAEIAEHLFTNYLLGSNLIAKDNEYEFFKEVEHSQTFLICKFCIRK